MENQNLDEQEKKNLARLNELQENFRVTYRYIIGNWNGALRAKSTQNGQFVSLEEVIDFINQNR